MKDPARNKIYNRRYYLRHQQERQDHMRQYRERCAWLLLDHPSFTLDMRQSGLRVVSLRELRGPMFRFIYRGKVRTDSLEAL